MKISYFNSFPKKGQPHTSDGIISIPDFVNAVKFGKWKDLIEIIRKEEDKAKRSILKTRLTSVTISGTFIERLQDNLIEHSGFICIDIDGYNDKEKLIKDKYTYALFQSASGNGLACIVKVNPEKHKESFQWLRNYYFNSFGIVVDPAPQNVASLRFVSYDPDTYINQSSTTSKVQVQKPKKIQSIPVVVSDNIVGEMVQECCNLGISLANDYYSHLRLGFAIANGFGESGRAWFHSLCSQHVKYNSQQAEKQYNICLKGADKSGVTVGTFYWMLKDAGIHIPNDSKRAVQIASMGKKSGRNKEVVIEQLVTVNGLNRNTAEKLTEEVFNRDDITMKTVAADPEQLIESLMEWLRQNHPFKKNIITGKIEEKGSDLTREKLNSVYLRGRSVFNTPNVTYDLIERIVFSEFTPQFNPLCEYIDKNRYRNTSGNLQKLIECIETDTPHAEIFIKKWCISLIAAIEGYPVRSVLALTGGQNSGKTEFFRRLLPSGLKKYYGESKLDNGKDDELLMCQKLILMDDEMGGKSKQDEKRFKELTSKDVFSLRTPYGKHNEDFKRLALLCGTSNENDIIKDVTGNTRILPVNVLSINHELYNSINKDELFIELVRLYESGEEWQLDKSELLELADVSNDFEQTPFERELISKFFAPTFKGAYTEFLTATEIKDVIEANSKQKIQSLNRFGVELRRFFGEPKNRKRNGSSLRMYEVVRCMENLTSSQRADNEDLPF